jgi:hypothetical protein
VVAAGVAAFASVLVAGAASLFAGLAAAGAVAGATTGAVAAAGALGASAANAVAANKLAITVTIDFILNFLFKLNTEIALCKYINA